MSDKQMRNLKTTRAYNFPEGVSLPSFSLTTKDLPAIKNWSVGHKYKLEMEVEQIEMAKSEYMEGNPLTARFRILKIKDDSGSEEDKKAKMGY